MSAQEDYQRRMLETASLMGGTRPTVHYIRETEHGPPKATPCGQRLWEVVHDLAAVPVATFGEFRVHPLTASGLLANVDCLPCLRKLAEASGAK